MWSLLHKGLDTMETLQRKLASYYLNPNWCVLCNKSSESSNHLFLHSKSTMFLWDNLQQKLNHQMPTDGINSLCISLSRLKPKICEMSSPSLLLSQSYGAYGPKEMEWFLQATTNWIY